MKSDTEATLVSLRRRLTIVRKAQTRVGDPFRAPPNLLVSSEWFLDALETRALELENLVVLHDIIDVAVCNVCGTKGEAKLVRRSEGIEK